MLTLILFCSPVGGHANRAISTAVKSRRATPGRGSLAQAFDWMKDNLPSTAVVAAHWNHGSQLNVLAGVKTIVDQDHYISHWIDLYRQHVNFAKTEREALEFLKSHTATHLMLTVKKLPLPPSAWRTKQGICTNLSNRKLYEGTRESVGNSLPIQHQIKSQIPRDKVSKAISSIFGNTTIYDNYDRSNCAINW